MSEIISRNTKQANRKIHSTKVDLTPMVDLGFLLITFFIFTTTLSTNTVMSLVMPKESVDSTKVAASGAVSLIASKDEILLMRGNTKSSIKTFKWNNISSLRQEMIAIKHSLIKANGNDDKLFVLIKPLDNSSFGQVINLFDEMSICGIRRYSMTDLSAEDLACVQTKH
jgi:biopolymer transport protein ExbD